MGWYNMKAISKKIAGSRRFQRDVMRSVVKSKFVNQKKKALKTFDNHVVTQEIKGQESATTSVKELGEAGGNLFTFIGFRRGSDPIHPVRSAIDRMIQIKFPKFNTRGKQLNISYIVTLPTLDDLVPVSPMPWGGGSWVKGLERGISEFDAYLYKPFKSGRSGMATQATVGGKPGAPMQSIRIAKEIRQTYITEILESFRKEFRRR